MHSSCKTLGFLLLALYCLWFAQKVAAKQPPQGIVGDVLDAEILILPELSGALLRRSNFPVVPSRITVGADGALYVIDNDENDNISDVQAVALYDKVTQRATSQWALREGGVLRDLAVSATNNLYLLDNRNKSIEVLNTSGDFLREIRLDGIAAGAAGVTQVVNPDTIALDANDNIYVLDKTASGSVIFKFSAAGAFRWRVNAWGGVALNNISDIEIVDINGAGSESLYLMQDSNTVPLQNTYVYEFALDGSQVRLRDVTSTGLATFLGSSRFSYTPPNVGASSTSTPYFYVAVNSQNGLRIRQTANWQRLSGGLGGAESQWNGISTIDSTLTPRLDVAAVGFNEIYVVDANDGIIRRLGAEVTSAVELLNTVEPPLGSSESIDEDLRSSIAALLSDSSFTSGVNISLLAYNEGGDLTVYSGNTAVFDRVMAGSLLPPDATLSLDFDYAAAVQQANHYIAGLMDRATFNSCINTHLLYVGPGSWSDTDQTIEGLSSLSRSFLQIQPVGYSLGEDTSSPQRNNILRLADAVNSLAETSERALFPLSKDALSQALGNFFNDNAEASSGNSTVAPSLTSQVVVFDDGVELSLLRARFDYIRDSNWQGHLERISIGDDNIPNLVDDVGNVLTPIWDAGEILASRNSNTRRIWTVSPGLPAPTTNYNNFILANAPLLNSKFFPELRGIDLVASQTRTNNLITYIRGGNPYGETAATSVADDRVWKLAETYNGEPLIVGAPNSPVSLAPEDSRIESGFRGNNGYNAFRQSNVCGIGITCANRRPIVYAPGNGGMLHAFDWRTGEELWGFVPPQLLSNFVEIESGEPGSSRSIFAVDATPVSKDVLINGQWRTVLFGNLGRGGKGFFVLDITNPDQPAHLFSIENDSVNDVVHRWNAEGVLRSFPYESGITPPPASDYSRLGETWSEPVIINAHVNGTVRNLAVFGGGYNNKVDSDIGDRLYAVDLAEEGDITFQWSVASSGTSYGPIANAIPASPVAVTTDAVLASENFDYGAIIYVGDLAGRIWKFDLTGQITSFQNRQRLIFDGAATVENGRYIFNRIAPTVNADGEVVLTFGTGDIDELSSGGSTVNNYYAGIVDNNFPSLIPTEPTVSFSDLQDVTTTATATCPLEEGRPGWSYVFEPNERLISSPDILNQTALFTTYTPGAVGLACQGFGFSSFQELNVSCGTPFQTLSLGEGVARKVNFVGDRVVIAIASPEISVVKNFLDADEASERVGGVVSLVPSDPDSGDVRIELWQQISQ